MTDQPDLADFVADNLIHADTLLRAKLGFGADHALPVKTLTALRAMPANFQDALGSPILDKLIAHFRRPVREGATPLLWAEHANFIAADEAVAATLNDAFAMAMQNMSAQAQTTAQRNPKLLRVR